MSETLNPRQGPRELKDSQLENAREHLDLRFRFAEAVSTAKGTSLPEALRDYTDLYVRSLGTWPGESDECDGIWAAYVETLRSIPERGRQIDETISFFLAHKPEHKEHKQDTYWPFRYDYSEKDKSIKMHFGSMGFDPDQEAGEPGILSRERLHEQREKLKAMFTEIKEKYPDAKAVRGRSWLYNREAYRRLFPAVYTEKHAVAESGFQGGGTWGQFRTKDGGVDTESKEQFLAKIKQFDPHNLRKTFPLDTWVVSAPIEEFYKEYGIE